MKASYNRNRKSEVNYTVSKALYRKYRSKSLGEIVGQDHVTDILARSLAAGRIAHAYLLTGPRGVGKTSIARILAYEINKLPYDESATHLDIIEIDAASNNGVEDVRELREKVQIAPVSAHKKIYIIDEVHMLSKAAFNALLKTLEEPPEHAVFILATTDADKLPATIISRTQQFNLRTIAPNDAFNHLKHIADEEKIKIDDDALELIAIRGDGSFRDSISLLDQLRGLTNEETGITRQRIEQSLGLAPIEHVEKLLNAFESRDLRTIIELLDKNENSGIQPSVLVNQLIQTVRKNIIQKPQQLELLDQLLEVTKSSQPNIKLLTVLAMHAVPKPKTAALAVPSLEISAPIRELEDRALHVKPAITKQIPSRQITERRHQSDTNPIKSAGSTKAKPLNDNKGRDQGSEKDILIAPANLANLDWEKVVEYARQNFVAIYSVLTKCGYEIDDEKLIIYTSNAFYKKKLDDTKHHTNLLKALIETGVGNVYIETIGTPPPPKDSTAAAVAAIMGGGEEVTVDA
jgi:DNA polymerase-3 subunit gamma/tau